MDNQGLITDEEVASLKQKFKDLGMDRAVALCVSLQSARILLARRSDTVSEHAARRLLLTQELVDLIRKDTAAQ